jgi:hypothetical protein
MKESVAVAKEADAKKGVSPTKSDNSIHRVRNEPERQLGSLRDVIGNIRREGDTPSVESIATRLSGMHSAERAPALLALQQTHGNRYVQRVVSGIQAKLAVGQPGDVYEQEADRVADQVMRMLEPRVQRQFVLEEEEEILATKPLVDQITPLVQRQVEEEEEEILQFKESLNQSPAVSSDLESNIQSSRAGGTPLPESVRAFFEQRFGHDFRNVKLHKDASAADSVDDYGAKAYTIGENIVFASGEYAPESTSGRRLLAHELTHVVQQRGILGFRHRSDSRYGARGSLPIRTLSTDGILVQRLVSESVGRQIAHIMHDDLSDNITSFVTGLNSACISFQATVQGQLRNLDVEAKSRAWVSFAIALAGLTFPAVAPLLGLLPAGITMLVGTGALLLTQEALRRPRRTEEELTDLIAYVIGRFISPHVNSGSVAAQLDGINREIAAREGFNRHRQLVDASDTVENRDRVRRAFQLDLFETGMLDRRHTIMWRPVAVRAQQRMERLWNLSTVVIQSRVAFSRAGFGPGPWSIEAFGRRAEELFPGWREQMRQYMPRRYRYWRDLGGVRLNNMLELERDLATLADHVRAREFGTRREALPAISSAD